MAVRHCTCRRPTIVHFSCAQQQVEPRVGLAREVHPVTALLAVAPVRVEIDHHGIHAAEKSSDARIARRYTRIQARELVAALQSRRQDGNAAAPFGAARDGGARIGMLGVKELVAEHADGARVGRAALVGIPPTEAR
jgi:hypothetical protein